MIEIRLANDTDFDAWRVAARRLRQGNVAPEQVVWRVGGDIASLFAEVPSAAVSDQLFSAPRTFMALAGDVVMNRAEDRFDLLYRLLWRLRDEPRLVEIVSDADVARALRLQKSVHQAIHKMHAFVRFRRVEGAAHETYIAWFEPAHRVAVAAADWFVQRMANLRFSILTPEAAIHWDGAALSTTVGVAREAAPDQDVLEDYWRTYYASVFNPARLNAPVMTQHMPRRYWRNLPEAALIPELVSRAQGRTEVMVNAAPTSPPARAGRLFERQRSPVAFDQDADPDTLEDVAAAIQSCRRCNLWRDATQGVAGEGPPRARLMLVGEQPGDQEDLAGRPFVGPAGVLLDSALTAAGVSRDDLYVTNAVKHFKHELRGKRRLHKTPGSDEVRACRWWLEHERRLVAPKVIITLGATAAAAVLGRSVPVTKARGPAGTTTDGAMVFITVHPSYLLRMPDETAKRAAFDAFVADLKAARALVEAP